MKHNRFRVKLCFYPNSYDMTHDLEVSKGRWHIQVYTSAHDCQAILDKLGEGDGVTWAILRLINNLSYRVRHERLYDYVNRHDIDSVLKSVWYSMNYNKYAQPLRRDVVHLVKLLHRYLPKLKENKWSKKIIGIEKKIFWKKVFTDDTSWDEPS